MSRALAEWLTQPRTARFIVALAGIVGTAAAVAATRVDHDDDLLAFLPDGDADVSAFRTLNEAFGGLDVAIVGVEADNPIDPELFAKLRALTKALNDAPEVKFALSLANVDDFRPSPDGGIETDLLVRDVPDDLAGQRRLRQKIMSRDLVVGQLIAPSGKAVILYAFRAFGSDPRVFARRVQGEVYERFPARSVYLGGAPFVSSYIYDSTQADLRRLTPWAVAVIVLLVFLAFRDVRGVVLALLATGFGIVAALALMVVTQQRYNIVLSSMPVILFSVGSAYSIHVLARYYALAAERSPREALVEALTQVGPTVVAAAVTTMAGLLSFLAMDIQPLRSFGLFTAVGIAAALLSSLTFVPAVVVVFGIDRGRVPEEQGPGWLTRVTVAVARHRVVAVMLSVAVLAVGLGFTAQVDTRMDQSAFFAEDSVPARADRFLQRHFGGSTFIQIHGRSDFGSAAGLRAWTAVADEIEGLKHVSTVQHAAQVVAQLNAALAGERRVPDTDAQVRLLYRFLDGRPAIRQLVTADLQQAVMHIKVSTGDLDEMDATLAAVEQAVARRFDREQVEVPVASAAARTWMTDYLTARIDTLVRRADVPIDAPTRAALARVLAAPPAAADPKTPRGRVENAQAVELLVERLLSPECVVDFAGDRARATTAAEALLLSDEAVRRRALTAAFADASFVDDVLYVGETEVPDAVRRVRVRRWMELLDDAGLRRPGGAAGRRLAERIRDLLMTAVSKDARILVTAADEKGPAHETGPANRIEVTVSGLPVLHRGLSRSARRNQIASLGVALVLVAIVLCVMLRSLRLGLVATLPTVLTLAAVYGAMGALDVHLDIGTSMLASLIIGAGVDYAVHLVAAYRSASSAGHPEPLAGAVQATGDGHLDQCPDGRRGFLFADLGRGAHASERGWPHRGRDGGRGAFDFRGRPRAVAAGTPCQPVRRRLTVRRRTGRLVGSCRFDLSPVL